MVSRVYIATLLMTFLSVPFAVYDITPQLSKTCYRLQMKKHHFPGCPITRTTREVYVRKLKKKKRKVMCSKQLTSNMY